MIGIDTSFLVAFEIQEHPSHQSARLRGREHSEEGFALAQRALAEFAPVVTDARRFEKPLTMGEALSRAEAWWNGREVTQVQPSAAAMSLFFTWMNTCELGRKRLLDTMLAATYKSCGVSLVLSTNWRDFARFPGVHPVTKKRFRGVSPAPPTRPFLRTATPRSTISRDGRDPFRRSPITKHPGESMSMTEQELEQALIGRLTDLKYTYRPDVFAASTLLREINSFTRDDGTPLNDTLVNIKDWCKNSFEVVNQLCINTQNGFQRHDVMLLINGVPVVQIELKTLGISPRRAMQQIVDYKKDPGNGYTRTLLCFVQLFIVSNRTETWYFANNNDRHFAFDADEHFLPIYQHAAEDNTRITHLDDFADSFLPKCTLGTTISRSMVLVASEQMMLMMRPYQVYAVRAIDQCIREHRGNGFIWHATGSGKTLTSFKASTLLKLNPDIHKCLFVVDRKDLDRQIREEFNRFQEGCVEENTNTAALVPRLVSDDYADKVIVTTIQKLGLALDQTSAYNKPDRKKTPFTQRLEPLRDRRMVFIFDECHRSQFGQTHQIITNFFPRAQLFGFTGTPIFEENATARQIDGDIATLRTTGDLFQNELHAYTITHAIEDRYVLRFHVDYFKPEGESPPGPGELPAKHDNVDEAITLFSGVRPEQAKEIRLVDKAPVVIERLKDARQKLNDFMQSQGVDARPEAVPNLRGDSARIAFARQYREIQRLATQLDQYTDLTDYQRREIEQTLPKDEARAFRGVYLEIGKRLKALRETPGAGEEVGETPEREYGAPDAAIDQFFVQANVRRRLTYPRQHVR